MGGGRGRMRREVGGLGVSRGEARTASKDRQEISPRTVPRSLFSASSNLEANLLVSPSDHP